MGILVGVKVSRRLSTRTGRCWIAASRRLSTGTVEVGAIVCMTVSVSVSSSVTVVVCAALKDTTVVESLVTTIVMLVVVYSKS